MVTTSSDSAFAEVDVPLQAGPATRKQSLVPLTGALASAAVDKLRGAVDGAVHASPLWRRALAGPAPDRLLAQPRTFYTKSLVEAEMLLAGRYRLPGGEADTSDGSPFFSTPPSQEWLESLHSFEWLRHLEAIGGEPAQHHVRQLIAHWMRNYGSYWSDVPWRPHVTARRLMSWSSSGRMILANADILFRSRVLWTMARQARHLAHTAKKAPPGLPRMTAIIGLAQSGVTLPDGESRLHKGLQWLGDELNKQILPDGGHISRDPEAALAISSDLLSLMDGMRQRGMVVPAAVRRALDRMAPMIRFMTLGDGKLASFNGGSEGPDGWSALLLTQEESRHKVLNHAPHTGYERLSAGDTAIVVDTGTAPPLDVSTRAHAGTLSFEMSTGTERLIVNCGAPRTKGPEWMQATRATAAHSTLTVADTSSAALVAQPMALSLLGPRLMSGPTKVEVKRSEVADGVWLAMSHDGYAKPFGLMHERKLFISNAGHEVRGEDRVVPSARRRNAALPVAVRFHLHPDVRATLGEEADVAILSLASGETWRMRAEGGTLTLGESVYCGSGDAIRKTQQVVITASSGAEPLTIPWSIRRTSDAADSVEI